MIGGVGVTNRVVRGAAFCSRCRTRPPPQVPGCEQLMLGANRPGVGGERVIVGKPAVHSNRRRSIKPREERQFLQMVCKAVRTRNCWDVRASERITYFKIALACAYLSRVTPGGSRIVAERVVHPFPDFMGCNRCVVNVGTKGSRGLEINESVRLDARCLIWSDRGVLSRRRVETENATF